MTSHELAHQLLEKADLPVVTSTSCAKDSITSTGRGIRLV